MCCVLIFTGVWQTILNADLCTADVSLGTEEGVQEVSTGGCSEKVTLLDPTLSKAVK